jgi:UDP-N-acetylmuramoylalanine--D-glutamate ligase
MGDALLSPPYACVTNLSPDHLNRYRGMADYAEAKKHILRWQGSDGVAVLNGDDAEVAGWAAEAPGHVIWFGAQPQEAASDLRRSVFYNNAGLWWSSQQSGQQHAQRLCTLKDISLPGRHNLANIAAAAALVKSFGGANIAIKAAVRQFGGVPHRLELIRELDGVRYINDTTATAPEAAIAALQSFDAPAVLICGGADKDLPFDGLAQAIVKRARAVVLLSGTATPKLQQALSAAYETAKDSPAARFAMFGPLEDFEQAITTARGLAEPGDIVLLSPGCASFGMFLNEFQRGDEFRRIVLQL